MSYHFAIIGTGAIGLGLAHLLCEHKCTMLARNHDNHARAALSVIEIDHETKMISADVCTLTNMTVEDWTRVDLLILPVKFYHLSTLIEQLRSNLPDTLPLLLLQNGLGGHELLSDAFPNNPIYLGSTTDAIATLKPQKIQIHARGELVIGSLSRALPSGALRELMKAHPNAIWEEQIMTYLYRKLAVNAVINPLTAKYQCRNGELSGHLDKVEVLKQEVFTLYQALSLNIELPALNNYIDSVIALTTNNYSSMYQDVKHRRPTEIDSILGVLLTKAAAHKVPLPLIQSLYDEIKAL